MKHALLLAAVASAALAQTTINLDVKPGLWETTTTTQTSGMPALDNSKMTPEMRARVEEMMKKRQAKGPSSHTSRSCMTKEKLQKDMFMNESGQVSCKRTILTNTRSSLEVKVECSSDKAVSAGTFHLEALSRESVKGNLKLSGMVNADTAVSSKWIGADCGDVK